MKGHSTGWTPRAGDEVSGLFKGYAAEDKGRRLTCVIEEAEGGFIQVSLQDFTLSHQFRKLRPEVGEVVRVRCLASAFDGPLPRFVLQVGEQSSESSLARFPGGAIHDLKKAA